MESEFINLTAENICEEHLCCIIRSKKPHPGVEAKRSWLSEQLKEGHVFRKLNTKGCCFIEYAPLEKAWVPITGNNFYYIYCLWVDGKLKGKGYGRELMEYCIADAREKGKSGICMLGAKKQKNWLSNQAFAKKYGFETVDVTDNGYIYDKIEDIRQYCESDNIPVSLIVVDSLQKAKELPCVFNNWGAFYQGQFITVNLLDVPSVQKILKKGEQHDGKN